MTLGAITRHDRVPADGRTGATATDSSWPEHTEARTPTERLAEVVRDHPDHVAILENLGGETRRTSYAELDELANRIGNGIRARGGDQLTTVGVLTDQSVAHVAAVFGALKTGLTVVPLDLSNPPARLRQIIDHSGCGLVVTDEDTLSQGLALGPTPVLSVDDVGAESDVAPRIRLDPEAIARITYTSGSTGRPKGVMHSHRFMLEKTRIETAFYGFGPHDRLSQLFPMNFLASAAHTLGALLNGGTLCPYDVPTQGMHHLAEWIRDTEITGLGMVPTLFRRFLAGHEDPTHFDTVRFTFMGAELVLRTDVDLYQRLFPDESLFINHLASTETGPMTKYVVDKETVISDAVVPAGYAVEGRELVIVDDEGNPVPDGEVGELWVRSEILAAGYRNDPELTERNFGTDPHDPALRIFRTGDLATRAPDGLIVHLGRKDSRVKVRGYGVDLVELERTLLAVPGVTEGAVVLDESAEDPQLTAAYVGDPSLDPPEMRRRLQERVPDYMIPASFIRLERLPLTPRGKIDRRALADLKAEPVAHGERVAPVTELEHELHALWCRTLRLEEVGVEDSFFDLGGSSIQAYELVGDIYREFEVDLPATSLLEAATIRAQAALIAAGGPTSRRGVVPIRATGSKAPLFGVPGGGGGVLYLEKLAKYIDEERPIYALPREMSTAGEPEYQTVEEMAESFLSEMRSVQASGPYLLLGSCFGGQVAHEMARTLAEEGEEVALLIAVDPPTPSWEGKEHWKHRPWTRQWLIGKARRRAIKIVRFRKRRRLRRSGETARHKKVLQMSKQATRAYTPAPSPVPLVVLAARDGTARQEWYWGEVAFGGLDIEEFKSDHKEMYMPGNRRLIAEMIQRRLDLLEAGAAAP